MERARPHAILYPFPAQGHINPMMQLARLLAETHGFLITFVNSEHNHALILEARKKAGNKLPQEKDANIRFMAIPDEYPADHKRAIDMTAMIKVVEEIMPAHLEKLIIELNQQSAPVTCMISDVLCVLGAKVLADKFGLLLATLWPSLASNYWIFYNLPLLVSTGEVPADGLPDGNGRMITSIPDVKSLRPEHLTWLIGSDEDVRFNFQFMAHVMETMRGLKWVLFNTFLEVEGKVLRTFPPEAGVCAIGPMLPLDVLEGAASREDYRSTGLWPEDERCLAWLDGQADGSVIYVSFGSTKVLSTEQLHELAMGLEDSQQPFLWVVRPDIVDGSPVVLPPGFAQRTAARSLLIPWAPQLLVLSHPAVGGFLTHCGWNSTLESIALGVPMLTWPFFADQFLVHEFVVNTLQIGLSFRRDTPGLVQKAEVAALVHQLMQGDTRKSMARRVAALSTAALTAMRPGGASFAKLQEFILAASTHSRPLYENCH